MKEQAVIEKCKEVVLSKLKSPISAQFNNITIVEEDNYGKVLLDVSVDSQNGFGAMIRSDFGVILFEDGENYKSLPNSLYKKNFINTINVVKKVNFWNQPAHR